MKKAPDVGQRHLERLKMSGRLIQDLATAVDASDSSSGACWDNGASSLESSTSATSVKTLKRSTAASPGSPVEGVVELGLSNDDTTVVCCCYETASGGGVYGVAAICRSHASFAWRSELGRI